MTHEFLSLFASVIKNRTAMADKRIECFYVPMNENTEAHITVSLKPTETGKYTVIRNNVLQTVLHAAIMPSDLLVVKVQIDMFALTTKTIHRFQGASEYVKVSSSVEIGISLDSNVKSIVPLTRNSDKQLSLTDMLRLKGKQFAHITESVLLSFCVEKTQKFVNKVVNNTPAESRKREFTNRDETSLTIYGKFKAQQSAKRAAKLAALLPASAIVTTDGLSETSQNIVNAQRESQGLNIE